MGTWFTVAFIILLVATLVMMLARRSGRGFAQGAPGAGYAAGTLTITGVSGAGARDKNEQAYFTFTGTIVGPQTPPTEVYGTLALGPADQEPKIGDDKPVIYKPGKTATSWRFGTLEG
ncbi:hypothetical protein [Gordonia sp. (in: high G+C Gram-positive bacteria)]|uniref:hypothetical protein n=1 Tax=Gordonia sp. (in: high G+C Gram-positive bacteria) TaxID=84139 RepID=UPI0035283A69